MFSGSTQKLSSTVLFLLILLLFFLSGASSLVYQTIWVRLLTRVFGTTTFAVSTLLAAFMAGLGLGAYLAGRNMARFRSPLRWFGLLEIGIGVYAFSLDQLIPLAESLFSDLVSGWGLSLYHESLLKVVMSFIILLPPTTLMGASLPLLVQQTVDRLGYLGMRTGGLYALNTFGAAVGCFLAGFYVIARWGMAATTNIAVAVNLLVGVTAILLSFLPIGTSAGKPVAPSERPPRVASFRWAVFAFTISGFVAIGLEVIWTRLFTLVFKGYTYSFSSMLTILLAGIAMGSIAFARRADRSRDLQGLLGKIQVSAAVAVLALSPAFLISTDLLSFLTVQFGYDWLGATLAKSMIAFIILFIPTFLFGAQFPVVARLATERVETVGGRVGNLYAANVVGSIVGALMTGFVFIPVLGTHYSLWLLCGSLLFSGALLLAVNPQGSPASRRGGPLLVAVATGVILAFFPSDLSRAIHESWLGDQEFISYYKEGTTATVMVADFPSHLSEQERILINGSSASNSTYYGLSVNRIQGCLPFLFDRMPKKVLAVCFGTGITFGTLSQFDIEHMDGVEISPEVIEAASRFEEENYGVVGNQKVAIQIDDGRNFLLKTKEKYDVITMEPMPPALAGVADLYTSEFYRLCRNRLASGGIMSQWVPLYYLGYQDIQMLYRTFAESFPYTLVFFHNFDTFLVGSNQRLMLSPQKYIQRLKSETLIRDLTAIGLSSPEQMIGTFLMDRQAVLDLAETAPVITDDLPYVEFTAPKTVDMSPTAMNYLNVTQHAKPAHPYLVAGSGPRFEQLIDSLQTLYEQNVERWAMARMAQERRQREREGALPGLH
jgi:spermidine synthase